MVGWRWKGVLAHSRNDEPGYNTSMPLADPFRISDIDVQALSANELRDLVNDLLFDEIHRSGSDEIPATTSFNTVGDGGIDAQIVGHRPKGSTLIPEGDSVWQYRSATKFPAKANLNTEVNSPRHEKLRDAITAGSEYVFVTNSRATRPDVLIARRAELMGIVKAISSKAKARLLSAPELANWCTSVPWTRWRFGRAFPNTSLLSLEVNDPEHQDPFVSDALREATIDELRSWYESGSSAYHIHVEGLPGVGKTRLLVEAFRSWGEQVLFSREEPNEQLMTWLQARDDVTATIVVDDCDSRIVANRVGHRARLSGGRIRVVTVGHDRDGRPDCEVVHLNPLSHDATVDMVQRISALLGHEQAEFVAQISQGYARLARLLAREIAKSGNPLSVTTLADVGSVDGVLKRILPDGADRRAAQVVALFTRAGWEEELEPEGRFVAESLGLDWLDTKSRIEELCGRRVIQRLGRFRAVTPELLAVWLAADAWRKYSTELRRVFDGLAEDGRGRMLGRMGSLAGVREVEEVTKGFLVESGPFGSLAQLDTASARAIGVLAEAVPSPAASFLHGLLSRATEEELLQFGEGRRHVVWTLESLAWRAETFDLAAESLCRLALYENETWENNAQGTWSKLFLVRLGATEVPWQDRVKSLFGCVNSQDPRAWRLAVSAIDEALTAMEIGQGYSVSEAGEVPRQRWRPATWNDDWSCRRTALELADKLLSKGDARVTADLLRVLSRRTNGLIRLNLGPDILARLEAAYDVDSDTRREMWQQLADSLPLLEDDPELTRRLEVVRTRLAGESLPERLVHVVGKASYFGWEGDNKFERPAAEARRIAEAVFEDPEAIDGLWVWLGSRRAENVGPFGRRLGELDDAWNLASRILAGSFSGGSAALAGEYLAGRATAGGRNMALGILKGLLDNKELSGFVVESLLRMPPSHEASELLLAVVHQGDAPAEAFWLIWGFDWRRFLKPSEMRVVLDYLLSTEWAGAPETALTILDDALNEHGDLPRPLLSLAWTLAERPPKLMGGGMASYFWERLLRYLAGKSPERAATALVRALESGFDKRDGRGLLSELLRDHPGVVWPELAKRLLANRVLAWRIGVLGDDGGLLEVMDPAFLLDWIERGDANERGFVVAQLTKPQSAITDLVRGLLARFGAESRIATILYGNFSSGSWSGEHSVRERRQLAIAKAWLEDGEPEVVRWARKIVAHIEAEIPQLERDEVERDR